MAQEQWQKWHEGGRKREHLAPLLTSFQPLIDHEVSRWSGTGLPRIVLEAEAKKHAIDAFHTYDPSKAQLQTHVMNRLRAMSTFANTYRSDVRMPNERAMLADKLTRARVDMGMELGREATDQELARRIGVGQTTIGKLNRFQTALYSRAEAGGFNQPVREDLSRDQITADFLYHDLSPVHKTVFAHTTGYGGKPVLTPGEIAKKLQVSPGRVSQLKTEIAAHAKRYDRAVNSLME